MGSDRNDEIKIDMNSVVTNPTTSKLTILPKRLSFVTTDKVNLIVSRTISMIIWMKYFLLHWQVFQWSEITFEEIRLHILRICPVKYEANATL